MDTLEHVDRPCLWDGRVMRDVWLPGDDNGDADPRTLERTMSLKTGHPTWKIYMLDVGEIVKGVAEPPRFVYLDDTSLYQIFHQQVYQPHDLGRYWPYDFSGKGTVHYTRPCRGRPAYSSLNPPVVATVPSTKATELYVLLGGPPIEPTRSIRFKGHESIATSPLHEESRSSSVRNATPDYQVPSRSRGSTALLLTGRRTLTEEGLVHIRRKIDQLRANWNLPPLYVPVQRATTSIRNAIADILQGSSEPKRGSRFQSSQRSTSIPSKRSFEPSLSRHGSADEEDYFSKRPRESAGSPADTETEDLEGELEHLRSEHFRLRISMDKILKELGDAQETAKVSTSVAEKYKQQCSEAQALATAETAKAADLRKKLKDLKHQMASAKPASTYAIENESLKARLSSMERELNAYKRLAQELDEGSKAQEQTEKEDIQPGLDSQAFEDLQNERGAYRELAKALYFARSCERDSYALLESSFANSLGEFMMLQNQIYSKLEESKASKVSADKDLVVQIEKIKERFGTKEWEEFEGEAMDITD